jgi:hypothetical protein
MSTLIGDNKWVYSIEDEHAAEEHEDIFLENISQDTTTGVNNPPVSSGDSKISGECTKFYTIV